MRLPPTTVLCRGSYNIYMYLDDTERSLAAITASRIQTALTSLSAQPSARLTFLHQLQALELAGVAMGLHDKYGYCHAWGLNCSGVTNSRFRLLMIFPSSYGQVPLLLFL